MSTPQTNLFDVRTVERHMAEGTVTQEQYDAYLASLPDEAEEADNSSIVMIMHPRARRHVGEGPDEEEG